MERISRKNQFHPVHPLTKNPIGSRQEYLAHPVQHFAALPFHVIPQDSELGRPAAEIRPEDKAGTARGRPGAAVDIVALRWTQVRRTVLDFNPHARFRREDGLELGPFLALKTFYQVPGSVKTLEGERRYLAVFAGEIKDIETVVIVVEHKLPARRRGWGSGRGRSFRFSRCECGRWRCRAGRGWRDGLSRRTGLGWYQCQCSGCGRCQCIACQEGRVGNGGGRPVRFAGSSHCWPWGAGGGGCQRRRGSGGGDWDGRGFEGARRRGARNQRHGGGFEHWQDPGLCQQNNYQRNGNDKGQGISTEFDKFFSP